MDVIDNFLKHIYGNNQSLLYFYITLGFFALFLIILILILLFSSESRRTRKSENDKKKQLDASLSETQNFSNIIGSQEEVKTEEILKEEFNDSLVNDEVKDESLNEIPEEEKFSNNTETIYSDDDIYLEKEINNDSIKEEKVEVRELEGTIEMPKVKPMDIDDYLFNRQDEVKLEEPVKEENKKVELSNDELKNRLAKLKAKNKEKKMESQEQGLDDLMKAMGLQDNTSIVSEEDKNILK